MFTRYAVKWALSANKRMRLLIAPLDGQSNELSHKKQL